MCAKRRLESRQSPEPTRVQAIVIRLDLRASEDDVPAVVNFGGSNFALEPKQADVRIGED